nr:MAG TPA: peptidoglycan-recognition protein [Caudoviricetes sp.]
MVRYVTLDEVKQIAEDSREDIWALAKKYGREPSIIMHWSAGRFDQTFDDYHISILGDGKIYISTDDFSEVLSHTWKHNSGSVGISLCCAYGATTNDLGEYAPTHDQIEVMAQAVAIVAMALWLTIDKKHVLTHGEEADCEDGYSIHEPYGPKNGAERWDLEYLGTTESPSFNPYATDGSRGGDVLRGKANYYDDQL